MYYITLLSEIPFTTNLTNWAIMALVLGAAMALFIPFLDQLFAGRTVELHDHQETAVRRIMEYCTPSLAAPSIECLLQEWEWDQEWANPPRRTVPDAPTRVLAPAYGRLVCYANNLDVHQALQAVYDDIMDKQIAKMEAPAKYQDRNGRWRWTHNSCFCAAPKGVARG